MRQRRIVIACEDDIIREALCCMLVRDPRWSVCGEVADGESALKLARSLKPDIVIVDLDLPGINGLEATRQIRLTVPPTQVLVVGLQESEELLRQALDAGAQGCVLKSHPATLIIEALECLTRGLPFFLSSSTYWRVPRTRCEGELSGLTAPGRHL